MTDNEIIKALVCCANDGVNCKECPYEFSHTEEKWCDEVLQKDALDLINRQKAEIERLNAKIESLYKEIVRIALMTEESNKKEVVGDV